MAGLTQKQIDQRSGRAETFWRNVRMRDDGAWEWAGYKNNNHNTVDCESYDYGEFELTTDETSNLSRPTRRIRSKMAHHVSVFLTYGTEVPRGYEVFPRNGDHLDINPQNLWVRSKASREEWPAAIFCAANDNAKNQRAVA